MDEELEIDNYDDQEDNPDPGVPDDVTVIDEEDE